MAGPVRATTAGRRAWSQAGSRIEEYLRWYVIRVYFILAIYLQSIDTAFRNQIKSRAYQPESFVYAQLAQGESRENKAFLPPRFCVTRKEPPSFCVNDQPPREHLTASSQVLPSLR